MSDGFQEVHGVSCKAGDGFGEDDIDFAVLTDFKANVRIIDGTACVPPTVLPRKCLISRNGAISQLANKTMYVNLSASGMIGISVVVILVLTQLSVIRVNITLQPRIVCTGGMYHDTLTLIFFPLCSRRFPKK